MSATVTHILAPWEAELPPGKVGSTELVQRAGISYRRLDYWTRTGLLRADDRLPGSGYPRTYPVEEVGVAALIAKLTRAGVEIRTAAPAARELLATGHTTIGGIRLELPEEHL